MNAQPSPASAAAVLQSARHAWNELQKAESQMARLRSYAHQSRAMRDDLTKWSHRYGDAKRQLEAALSSNPS